PHTSPRLLEELALSTRNKNYAFHSFVWMGCIIEPAWGIFENPSVPMPLVYRLLQQGDAHLHTLAGSSKTSASILTSFAKHSYQKVRALVAKNPSTPTEVVLGLIADKGRVRCGVASSPNITPEAFYTLSQDPFVKVRCAVAKNPKTPKDLLEKLAKA